MAPRLGTACIADANPAHHMDSQITGILNSGGTIGIDPALQPPKLNPFGDYEKKGPTYAIGSEYHQLLCAIYSLQFKRRVITGKIHSSEENSWRAPYTGPAANLKIDFKTQKKAYFDKMGWDIKTGKPSKDTLAELGLSELTKDLSV
jgi:hypothetical protein